MGINIVTKRFIECVLHLKENEVISSYRKFALSLDTHPQSLSEILKGKRNVTLELTRKAVMCYHINPAYLYNGKGDMLLSSKEGTRYNSIIHISASHQDNYAREGSKPTFLKSMPSFTLPDYIGKFGNHRCFEVADDSMEPTIYAGEKLVCSIVDEQDWVSKLKNNFVYVIAAKNQIFIKRIVNRLDADGIIELFSDNTYFTPMSLSKEDIEEIWNVDTKISPFMASPSNQRNGFHEDINSMKETISQQSAVIKNLNSAIEKLLKQRRNNL